MSVNHPGFSRFYQRFAAVMERRGADAHRRRLLADLQGEVIEVGADHGSNSSYYPPQVGRVVLVEPEPHLRKAAQAAVAAALVSVKVHDGLAERPAALAEIRRVLSPSPHALGRAYVPVQA